MKERTNAAGQAEYPVLRPMLRGFCFRTGGIVKIQACNII